MLSVGPRRSSLSEFQTVGPATSKCPTQLQAETVSRHNEVMTLGRTKAICVTVLCAGAAVPDSISSSCMQSQQHILTRIADGGFFGDTLGHIIPASRPSLCDPRRSSECLQSQRYRRHNSGYVKAIIADTLASGPFEDFLLKKDCHKAQQLLNFWRDAQVIHRAVV